MKCKALLAGIALLGAALASCDSPTEAVLDRTTDCVMAKDAALPAALARAHATWSNRRLRNYSYEFQAVCECAFEHRQPLQIRVVNGKMVAITDADGLQVPLPENRDADPVEAQFTQLEQALSGGADIVAACFDADLGYPRRTFIDWNLGTADEEIDEHVAITAMW